MSSIGQIPFVDIFILNWDHEGFVSQDHIGGFSTKREYANTTQKAYKTIIMKLLT
jgi:hypothetical protein